MAPVVAGLNRASNMISRVCVTAQHREMLDPLLDLFAITPDYDLNLMTPAQDLFDITSKSLLGLRDILRADHPDLLLIQGDTTSCFAAALAAFYEHIPIGHIEAGLRTNNLHAPFPEEANRVLVGRLATLHFAPTEHARQNLILENIPADKVWVTGNTVIDALLEARKKLERFPKRHWQEHFGSDFYRLLTDHSQRLILVTGHRRENFGQGFLNLCDAIKDLALSHPDWIYVYPVHLNPNVRTPVFEILGGLENIQLIEPQDYLPFIWLMNRCDLVLTDSGGIQEEAPALGKPVLVMREVTERPEGIEAGTVMLVGTDRKMIIDGVEKVLLDENVESAMCRAHNPYGDGLASKRILAILKEFAKLIEKGH